jgi:hypothetical protein
MVGSWPCKVSSEIHINVRYISEPVREDKGKTTATEPEDEKDPKRACVVLSKGREVVRLGYSRLLGDAARVADRGEGLGNPNRVDGVHWEYDTYRWTDRVTWNSWNNRDGYSGWRADQVTRDSWGNWDGGSGQQADRVTQVNRGNRDSNLKSGYSSRVTEIWLTWKARLREIRLLRKAGLRRIRLTQKIRLCKTRGGGGEETGRRKM